MVLKLVWGPHFRNHCPEDNAQTQAAAIVSRKLHITVWQKNNIVKSAPSGTHPAQALDTDVIGVLATRCSIYHSVTELIVGCAPCHPAEQLAAVLHQN